MTVEPIKDLVKIKKMKKYLKQKNERNYLLFTLGLNTGLRISDLLKLTFDDIFTNQGNFRQYLVLTEQKTGKEKKILLNDAAKTALLSYAKGHRKSANGFLFESMKGGPLGRVQAYRVLKEAAEAVGVENFGTHSMRKTWGYWTYKASKYNIGLIMDTFNHSSQNITLRYIGINQEQKDKLYSIVQF